MNSCNLCNQGTFERFLRVVLGLGLLALTSETPWAYFGFIPLVTGGLGICPLYSLIGISSCKSESCDAGMRPQS